VSSELFYIKCVVARYVRTYISSPSHYIIIRSFPLLISENEEKKMYIHLTSNSEHTYNSTPKFSAYYTSFLSSLKGISMYIYFFTYILIYIYIYIYMYIYMHCVFQGTETCCVEGISWLLLYHLFRLSL